MSRQLRVHFYFLVLLLIVVASQTPADASQITFNFQGTVTVVNPALSGTFSPGQTISGNYTFESTTADIAPGDPNFGGYPGASTNLSFTVGGYTGSFGSSGFNAINVGLSFASAFDIYQVNIPFTGAAVAGFTPDEFALDIRDTDQTAFANDSLPSTPPNLALFEQKTITLLFNPATGGDAVAVVASLQQIPEPSTLLLLGLGLVSVLRRGRFK